MYFVDREQVEAKLAFMENQLVLIRSQQSFETVIEKAALERVVHTIIESILDVGNAMIDGFIMRDPGSYDDIIDILTDEKVINEKLSVVLKELITFRKMLVQNYEKVDHSMLLNALTKYLEDLKQFPDLVRSYLTEELGPVSAFRN